ncbi:hypothetical protein HMPREF9206_1236 [Cutibacterium acnes J139]|nr:hypothetical protein HMPREF9206_1236 [Cutibacterium acnes J139]
MRQDTRSAWADPTLTLPAPKRRSRTFNVVLGVLLTIVAAGIAMSSSCGRVLSSMTRG